MAPPCYAVEFIVCTAADYHFSTRRTGDFKNAAPFSVLHAAGMLKSLRHAVKDVWHVVLLQEKRTERTKYVYNVVFAHSFWHFVSM